MVLAIDAERCVLPVPERWLTFPGGKQGANDSGGGMLCVAAAAVHFGLVYEAMPPSALLDAITPSTTRRSIARRSDKPGMLLPADLEALAAAGGMSLSSPAHPTIQQFLNQGDLWIALVRQRFVNPIAQLCTFRSRSAPGARKSVVRNHYLLVLDYLRGPEALVVFDPHPWNRKLYCVSVEMFERAWRAARRIEFPWSGLLLPRSSEAHAIGY